MKCACTALLLLFIILFIVSCQPKEIGPRRTGNSILSFDSLKAIRYTEVRREFENGYAFNDMGFQQVPEWVMYFMPGDSVKIYSPYEHRFIHYPIYFDHDSVFNTAREWFRLKKTGKDSIILQLLRVQDKKVVREQSNVYMKFYADAHLMKTKASVEMLRLPKHRDSLFIQKLSRRANGNPDKIDSSFAATSPVILKSAHPDILVKKAEMKKGLLDDFKPSDVYMHPEYDITINHAYRNFYHSFNVLIDGKGVIRFGELLVYAEDIESRKKVLKAIVALYLQRMLKIIPGTTLGFPHTSLVRINVEGIKN